MSQPGVLGDMGNERRCHCRRCEIPQDCYQISGMPSFSLLFTCCHNSTDRTVWRDGADVGNAVEENKLSVIQMH